MVQYRAIDKGARMEDVIREFGRDVEELKREVLTSMAENIAQTSPVDTGTYARNHQVRLRSGSFQPSVTIPENAPRHVDPGPPRSDGLQKMLADIAGMDMSKNTFVFRNATTHARFVEEKRAVYAQVRREVNRMIQDALYKVRAK